MSDGVENQNPQQAAGGGDGASSNPMAEPRSSLISSVQPPIGKDPASHHTDVPTTLAAAAASLLSPGSLLPKVLNTPSVKHSGSSADPPSALGSNGAPLHGVSEINSHLITSDFLAAASVKFFTLTAVELVDLLTPIVPFFAACRRLWAENHLTASNILLSETPDSLSTTMSGWTKASGEFVLTSREVNAVVVTIAMILKARPKNPPAASVWTALIQDDEPDPVSFVPWPELTELQTFQFVVTLSPNLDRIRTSWELLGLTGRELMAMQPAVLVDTMASIHELEQPSDKVVRKLANFQCHRVQEAILNALLNYEAAGQFANDGVSPECADMLQKHKDFRARSDHGGGDKEIAIAPSIQFFTPTTASKLSTIGSSSSCNEAAPEGKKRPAVERDGIDDVVPKKLNPSSNDVGDTSFMSQLGHMPKGTNLYSATAPSVVVSKGDGNIVFQQQAAVTADYKMFEHFNHDGWATFIRSFREESIRLPQASRRTLKDLVKPSVIEQLRDEFDFEEWEAVKDNEVVEWCFKRFGPRTAREAKLRLEEVKFYFNDSTMPQSEFTTKLVKFFADKITQCADFIHASKHWKREISSRPT